MFDPRNYSRKGAAPRYPAASHGAAGDKFLPSSSSSAGDKFPKSRTLRVHTGIDALGAGLGKNVSEQDQWVSPPAVVDVEPPPSKGTGASSPPPKRSWARGGAFPMSSRRNRKGNHLLLVHQSIVPSPPRNRSPSPTTRRLMQTPTLVYGGLNPGLVSSCDEESEEESAALSEGDKKKAKGGDADGSEKRAPSEDVGDRGGVPIDGDHEKSPEEKPPRRAFVTMNALLMQHASELEELESRCLSSPRTAARGGSLRPINKHKMCLPRTLCREIAVWEGYT